MKAKLLANPDLPELSPVRARHPVDRTTYYGGGGAKGYTGYPTLA